MSEIRTVWSWVALICFVCQQSYALETVSIDSIDDYNPEKGRFVRKTSSQDLKIVHPHFSVVLPKGWTAAHGGSPGKAETLNLLPNEDVQSSNTYFGINRMYARPDRALDEIFQSRKKKNRPAKYETWNKQRWIFWEDRGEGEDREMHYWGAVTIKKDVKLVVTAGAIEKEASKYRPQFMKILKSIEVR